MSDNIQLQFHHVSIIVSDTSKALTFYRGILGLKPCERPNMPFPGAWLQLGEQQIHLLEVPNPDRNENRPEHGGLDRHTAFLVNDLDALQQQLEQQDIFYTLSKSGRRALFCRDPDGNAVELIQDQSATN